MIVGFILLMVSLNPAGEVEGTAVDYFKDPYRTFEIYLKQS